MARDKRRLRADSQFGLLFRPQIGIDLHLSRTKAVYLAAMKLNRPVLFQDLVLGLGGRVPQFQSLHETGLLAGSIQLPKMLIQSLFRFPAYHSRDGLDEVEVLFVEVHVEPAG